MRARRLLVLAALSAAVAALSAGPVSSLPPQASESGHEHAHTHGPDGLDLDPRGRRTAAPGFAVDDALAPSGWQTAPYDGLAPTADQPDVAELATLPQYHAVYLYPSNKPPRYAQFARMFQADARAVSSFLDARYGRSVRWDERAGTDGNRYVDVTVVRSAYNAKQLGSGNQFTYVDRELKRVFGNGAKKYVAWLDAGSRYCGQGHLYQDTRRQAGNSNELRTTAIVYRPYSTTDANSGGFCRGRTLLHEIGHTLGAVQQVAPHAFDGAHCDDDDNDVMCYTSAASFDSGAGQFDYGNDDYWDPGATVAGNPGAGAKLPWWAVNLNKFVCPVAAGSADCAQPNTAPGY